MYPKGLWSALIPEGKRRETEGIYCG
jgi:hypothetical protein